VKNIMAVLALVLLTPQTAIADQMTTADLIELCDGRVTEEGCRLYILGVTEGASLAAGLAEDKAHFCIPEGVTATEMALIFKRVIRQSERQPAQFHRARTTLPT
jgi:hypothetical protein